ncbi:MAG: hypothetical protein ACYC2H_10185 [Thermoplasmatota archaeon]
MSSFEVLLRTSGRRLEHEGFLARGETMDAARAVAAYILGVPEDLVVLAGAS